MSDSKRRSRLCCLDLDTFFVSVERVLEPRLVGKPVIVGGLPGERGVVCACSYEARKFGVRSGMSLRDAGRLAPKAVYLRPRQNIYGDYAERVRHIAREFSPDVQVASIDEMYISFAGCERLYHQPTDVSEDQTIERVVKAMTHTIYERLGLPSSAGIAPSRPTAKIASALAKPAGVMMVMADQEAAFLAPLPLRRLPGVGPVAGAKLESMGLRTLGDIAQTPVEQLELAVGTWAGSVKLAAQGRSQAGLGDERPAFREHDVDGLIMGSLSNERTFEENVRSDEQIDQMLCALTERVCWRARKRGVRGRTISLKLRFGDFQTITRSKTVPPTHAEHEVLEVVRSLLQKARPPGRPVRLLGIGLAKLELGQQLSLLPNRDKLHCAVDAIRDKFGYESVRLAKSAQQSRRSRPDPTKGSR